MDMELIGDILSKLRLYSSIIKRENGEILWIDEKLIDLLAIDFASGMNIKSILGISIKDLINDEKLKVEINDNKYYLNILELTNKDIIIIYLNPIADYNNYETRCFCLEQIIENLNDGILLSDKEGKVVIYNKAMEELEKRNSKDMIGKYIWDAYGYKDINKSEHMQVFNSRIPIIDKYKAHAYDNGKPIYKLYSTFPIVRDGETIGVYSISKDETKLQSLLSETIELKRQLRESPKDLKDVKSNGTKFSFTDIIGSSEVMKELIKVAQSISWLDNNILIIGETGTGKEVLAQSIHNYGKRKHKPFIGVNCSAIPENLLESILFGTTKGAYTGAVDSPGLFEEVGEGTIFLDELDSMPINLQAKLLRALQEKSVRRVGGQEMYQIKCRVVSSMGHDPYKLIEEGKLRQDLFYRVAGYILYLPALKDRENDLFELVEYYISKNNIAMNKNVCFVTDKLKDIMKNYSWPGNIRELENFIENIMVRTDADDMYLRASNIPDYILDTITNEETYSINKLEQSLPETIEQIERKLIVEALHNNKWNVTKTAKDLGITRQSLNYRMRKLNINRY